MTTETQRFFVPGPLPGLNDMLAWCRQSRGRGSRYSAAKAEWGNTIGLHVLAARLQPVDAAAFTFEWVEPTKRRDPDNVTAGAKFILDALVTTQRLRTDGWRGVLGIAHVWRTAQDGEPCGVHVTMRPGDSSHR